MPCTRSGAMTWRMDWRCPPGCELLDCELHDSKLEVVVQKTSQQRYDMEDGLRFPRNCEETSGTTSGKPEAQPGVCNSASEAYRDPGLHVNALKLRTLKAMLCVHSVKLQHLHRHPHCGLDPAFCCW
jgi:hypothetical protein